MQKMHNFQLQVPVLILPRVWYSNPGQAVVLGSSTPRQYPGGYSYNIASSRVQPHYVAPSYAPSPYPAVPHPYPSGPPHPYPAGSHQYPAGLHQYPTGHQYPSGPHPYPPGSHLQQAGPHPHQVGPHPHQDIRLDHTHIRWDHTYIRLDHTHIRLVPPLIMLHHLIYIPLALQEYPRWGTEAQESADLPVNICLVHEHLRTSV